MWYHSFPLYSGYFFRPNSVQVNLHDGPLFGLSSNLLFHSIGLIKRLPEKILPYCTLGVRIAPVLLLETLRSF